MQEEEKEKFVVNSLQNLIISQSDFFTCTAGRELYASFGLENDFFAMPLLL